MSADCDRAGFSRSNPQTILHVEDENLAVPGLPGPCPFHNRVLGLLEKLIVDGDFQFHLFKQGARLAMTPVHLGDSLLPAASDHITHRDQMNLLPGQQIQHFIKPIGLNNGNKMLHNDVS